MRLLRALIPLFALLLAALPAQAQFTDQRTYVAAPSGTANAIVATVANLSAHLPGVVIRVKASLTNTGATTFNPGPSAVAVRKQTSSGLAALTGNEIVAGQIYEFVYDGSFYQLRGPVYVGGVQAKTAAYTVLPADCGSTISLGGSAFYAVTIGAASGFPSGCTVQTINTDTTRGKAIAADGVTTLRLFPLQIVSYINVGSQWVQSPNALKISYGGLSLRVNAVSGSDNALLSDCMSTGAGACATFQAAVDIMQSVGTGGSITADCESTYNQSVNIVGHIGTQLIGFIGNPSSPSSCQFLKTVAGTFFNVQDNATVTIDGFSFGFSGASGTAVSARQQSVVDLTNINLSNNVNGTWFAATEATSMNISGNITVNGSALILVALSSNSISAFSPTLIIPGGGVGVMTSSWFSASASASFVGGATWSVAGTAAGPKYNCGSNASISFSTSYPGGLTAGSAATGCQASPP